MAIAVPKYRRHPNGQAFVQHKSITRPGNRLYLGKYGTPESRQRYAQFLECKRRSESAARIGLKVQRSGLKESIVIGLGGVPSSALCVGRSSHAPEGCIARQRQ